MPPKRRARVGSNSADLFHYSNQVELTFKSQPKEAIFAKAAENVDSSESEDDNAPILKKKGKKSEDTSSSESSSASDSDVDEVEKPTEDSQDNVYEITDDDDVGPRPLTPPPPKIRNIAPTEVSRQAERLSRAVCDKMRYLQYLQGDGEQDTPSPLTNWSDVVIVQDGANYGTQTGANRKITIRIRSRNGVERFSLERNDTFQEIFSELAKKHDVNVDALSLSFTDTQGNFQTLKGTDTPNSVNLNVADIIECVVVHAESLSAAFENSDNTVNIKIQGSDSKTVKQFKALKNQPLGKIMQQYAEFRQLPLSKLRFSFDGETMTSEQSPDDLDMDEDNVVDVQIR